MTAPARGGGGAATSGGIDYQARVGAYVSALILAGESQSAPWQLSASTRLEALICEAEQPVDDIVVRTSTGGRVFIQAKRRTDLTRGLDSSLGSAVDQFARQFLATPLDRHRDRLVLATGVDTPEAVRIHLQRMVARVADLDPREDAKAGATNRQLEAFGVFSEHVDTAWRTAQGRSPSPGEVRALLGLLQIHWLTVDAGATDEQYAKFVLRSLLRNPDEADAAWTVLIERVKLLMSNRGSGIGRAGLADALARADIALLDAPTAPRVTGARLHEIARSQFGAQLRSVAAYKYDPALYVPRIATDGLASALADSEPAFRSTALALIDRLRGVDPPRGSDTREALARARILLQTSSSTSEVEESIRELKTAFGFDAVENIVRQINRAVAIPSASEAHRAIADVIARISEVARQPIAAVDVGGSLQVIRQNVLTNPTAPRSEMAELKAVLRLLPSEHDDDYKPVTLANDLIRALTEAADQFRRRSVAITAPAGDGKTNALCALGDALLKRHPVVLIDVQQIFTAGSAELAVRKALRGLDAGGDDVFAAVAPGLAESRQRLFVLIDGLDESREVAGLNAALRALLDETEESRFFVVVACRDLRWSQYEETMRRHLAVPPVQLRRFEDSERDMAVTRYMAARHVDARLSPEARETLRGPLLLRLFAETHEGQSLGDVHDLRPFDVFKSYLDHALEKVRVRAGALDIKEPVALLYRLGLKIWDERTIAVNSHSLGLSARDFDTPSSTLNELRNEGVLRTVEGPTGRTDVRFVYDELAEFVIARTLGVQLGDSGKARRNFVQKSIERLDFVLTIGVLVFLDRDLPGVLQSLFEEIRNDLEIARRHQAPLVYAFRAMKGDRLSQQAIETLAALESVLVPALKPLLAPVVLELVQHRPNDRTVMELCARILEVGGLVLRSRAHKIQLPAYARHPALPPARYHYSTSIRLAALTMLASSADFHDDGLVASGVRRLGQSELGEALAMIRALDEATDAAVLGLASQLVALKTVEYRVYCAWLLRNRYGAEASRMLLLLLLDEQTRVYRYAGRILKKRGADPVLIELVLRRLEDGKELPSWHLTQLLVILIGNRAASPSQEARITDVLQRASRHRSGAVRMTAFQALLNRADAAAAAGLHRRIASDSDPSVRWLGE